MKLKDAILLFILVAILFYTCSPEPATSRVNSKYIYEGDDFRAEKILLDGKRCIVVKDFQSGGVAITKE